MFAKGPIENFLIRYLTHLPSRDYVDDKGKVTLAFHTMTDIHVSKVDTNMLPIWIDICLVDIVDQDRRDRHHLS